MNLDLVQLKCGLSQIKLFRKRKPCTNTEIFTDMLRNPSLNATYLIIDALDECVTDLPKLLDFVAKHSSMSSCVKWIVSSCN